MGGSRTWWIGVLFAIGSTCFAVGALPGYLNLVGAEVDGITFFVGSIFFTSAALLQLIDDTGWASGIQLVGTLFFNRSTFRALSTSLDDGSYDHLVWAPDIFGCICFLVASQLAFMAVRDRGRERRIAILNLAGSVAFAASGVASFVAPDADTVRNMTIVNVGTCVGALCFLAGALLLLPRHEEPAR